MHGKYHNTEKRLAVHPVHRGSGNTRTITLGQMPKRAAESIRVKVEDLVPAQLAGHIPSDETSRWVGRLDPKFRDKLESVGLIQSRNTRTLGNWLDEYLQNKDELKPCSLKKLKETAGKLLDFFDNDIPLNQVTPNHGVHWRRRLKTSGLSEASVKTHCGNAKQFMAAAVRRKLIDESPFTDLRSGATSSQYQRYVSPDEIDRVISACPDTEWRLWFGLARYAGLRIPSESHTLTWADVDWERGRLTVTSPKTERHPGHERRVIPIVPKLMSLLQDRFDQCEDGEQHLVTITGQGAVIRQVRTIWARARVEPWKRLWQTLRSSCEKQLAMAFPQYAVSRWMGHSLTVSGKHYANHVPDELFDLASSSAQQNAQWNVPESKEMRGKRRDAPNQETVCNSRQCNDFPLNSADCTDEVLMEPAGFEPASRDSQRAASTRIVGNLISMNQRLPTASDPSSLKIF